MLLCVRGCHLGLPWISYKLIICAQSLPCLYQCTKAMRQRMESEFLSLRKDLSLSNQCLEKFNGGSSQLAAFAGWNFRKPN